MLNTYALFNTPTVSFLKSSTSAINTPKAISSGWLWNLSLNTPAKPIAPKATR